MGKVRKLRQKYHNSLKAKETKDGQGAPIPSAAGSWNPMGSTSANMTEPLIDQLFTNETLLAQPKITSQLLKQQFADFEERNTIATTLSCKSSVYASMKKQTKQKLRHQLWLKKVEIVQEANKNATQQSNRRKTAAVGDMQPLLSSCPDMTTFLHDVTVDQTSRIEKSGKKFKSIKKQATRAKDQQNNAAVMTAIMNDPDYRADPFSAIQTHLKLKFSVQD